MSDDDATATGLYAHADLAPGMVVAGRFRIVGLLGIGGMGVVYRAVDRALGVTVALKLLRIELLGRPGAFERFRQELLLARQVSSAHVVRIHDFAQHKGRWLISMDFIDGEGLDQRLDRLGKLPVDEALSIARQIAEGLRAAHAVGVVHRDLKPSNVLIDRAGSAFVNDFGVARSLASSGMTQSGITVGTPDYLSPEQARGEAVDPRSDLYALGLILYEMLGGELPFAGGTIAEILGQRIVRSPPPLTRLRPELPDWVARLVDRLLRSQPAHRLQDAGAVIAAIDRRQVPHEIMPSTALARRALALALAGIAVVAAGWWWSQQRAPVALASPPLQRLLLLPATHDGGVASAATVAIDDRLLGASAYLRDALDDAGVAVVDGERTRQAQRQSGADLDALRGVAVADRLLAPRLVRSGERWRVRAQWRAASAASQTIDGPLADDPVAALLAWWPSLATLDIAAPPPALPAAPAL
ncbi:MAG: serine/threonine-protein kinase, partial [Luteimonas sp.]